MVVVRKPVKVPDEPARIVSVSDYIRRIREHRKTSGELMTFRGQRAPWSPQAGILRPGKENLLAHEKEAVRDMISSRPDEFRHDATMFDRLVRMQHYGLPTRLMDVSANPLVALFLASETADKPEDEEDGKVWAYTVPSHRIKYYDSDAVSCLANLANLSEQEKLDLAAVDPSDPELFNEDKAVDRLVQFIRAEKPYFRPQIVPDDLFRSWYVIPKMDNARVVAQAGAFLIRGLESPKPLRIVRDITSKSFLVPSRRKGRLRSELNDLGVNDYTLFPDLERAAKNILRRYSPA